MSATNPAPAKKPVPRRGRIVVWLLAGALALLLAAGWFSTSQTALRWAVNQAVEMSGGQLVLEGVEGSVYGQLRIALLTYATPTKRYEARTVLINWSPSALARRLLQVDLLTVQELRVIELQPSTEPPPLPASLQLPVSLAVPVLQIERIVLLSSQSEQVLSHLALAVDKPADTYRLKLSRLVTPWGEARGELALAESAPFVLAGQLGLTREGELPYRLAANLSGQLARLGIDATATLRGGHAEAVAMLTPFDQRPLTEARITLSDIDPARLRKDLPQADIDGLIVLRNTGPDAFAGEVRLDNALAGPKRRIYK